jgi:hypothetical protein
MKDYVQWVKASASAAQTTGSPRTRDYLAVKLTETVTNNLLNLLLFALTASLWGVAIFGHIAEEARAWTFHAAYLCLGVFLGHFTSPPKRA